MQYSGAEIIIKLLETNGIGTVAGIPGGANLPLYDALAGSRIRHVLARHEQGAGFIAHGMARSTGRPAVCLGTSGPGATNLLTAVADAKLDSVPLIAITGQVATSLLGTDAFQEVDTYGLSLPITKHNFLVKDARELLTAIPESFRRSISGRPGPVVIDVPKDVQQQRIEVERWPDPSQPDPAPAAPPEDIRQAAFLINGAKRPLLYFGGGVISSRAERELVRLMEKAGIPAAATLMGLGAVGAEHPHFLGMLGMHGAKATNRLFREADLILALGVRFDDRATGKVAEFCPQADVLHVDIDASEIGKNHAVRLGIAADLREFLSALLPLVKDDGRPDWKKIWPQKGRNGSNGAGGGFFSRPGKLFHHLAEILDEDATLTTDVGQHQMWCAQYYPFRKPRTFLTSGGLGTMGFGLPAAIGAALAHPERQIVCITGDGSLLMNLQELATLREENLNVKILVLNNGSLGLVRQQQELFYSRNFIASRFKSEPDFVAIARGFGIESRELVSESEWKDIFAGTGPCLVNVPIHRQANVLPMVIPGRGNHEAIEEETAAVGNA